ncbi:flagellar export protein FliJ [Bartonella sp. HY406]|uniref:flagellar export protein FliJ n=1 Tax=Bartonella sp. HY406 TaxID=2979331 RepID=UPI0021CA8EAE|nr:flagellar export protein FliJ [Bartonella sp. HY406]UXN04752.1 flagellar export protein FliJ [Bartonella sp. HY406]
MKPRETIVRLKLFQVREKRRQITQLETMAFEFQRMANELETQIANEERKAGITDHNHFAYPTFAAAARQRRENLLNSANDLNIQKAAALIALQEAEAELAKAQAIEVRDGSSILEETISFVQRRSMIG